MTRARCQAVKQSSSQTQRCPGFHVVLGAKAFGMREALYSVSDKLFNYLPAVAVLSFPLFLYFPVLQEFVLPRGVAVRCLSPVVDAIFIYRGYRRVQGKLCSPLVLQACSSFFSLCCLLPVCAVCTMTFGPIYSHRRCARWANSGKRSNDNTSLHRLARGMHVMRNELHLSGSSIVLYMLQNQN